jgi:hypothetical protein
LTLLICVCPAFGASVSGVVVDAAGAPLAGTDVFLECGLDAALVRATTDGDGRYAFPSAAGEACGVFAVAPGKALDGYTVRAPGAEPITGPPIVLSESGSVSGEVENVAGRPVEGAQIARVVLMKDEKVGIPLGKLRAYSIEPPATDAKGRFELHGLPKGCTVALKVIHPLYAQRAVDGVTVGDDHVKVEMSPGIIVQGKVLARDGREPVANAAVQFWNASPPHDTALVHADRQGAYAVRLEPGVYRCRAFARDYASPNWQRVTVTGERPEQEMTLLIAGQGVIRGSVMDAVTGQPVPGARLVLTSDGSTAAAATTGPDGAFTLEAVEGENILRLEEAPGYLPPESPGIKASVVSGATLELPAFWLAPVPRYELHVVDLEGTPVANAAVSLLDPLQFGWRFSDTNGVVEIQLGRMPTSKNVVGLVEGPSGATSALFAIAATDKEPAVVQVRPMGSVEGMVKGAADAPVPGAVIAAWTVSAQDAEPVAVWRTVSGPDGRFTWPAVAADTPYRASVTTDAGQAEGSFAFRVPVGGRADAGTVIVEGALSRASMKGKRLEWWTLPKVSGAEPRKNQRAVVLYASAAAAPATVEACAVAAKSLGGNSQFVVVTDAPAVVPETAIPLLQGTPPGPATTYVVDEQGVVVLETFGMPPVRALYAGEGQ